MLFSLSSRGVGWQRSSNNTVYAELLATENTNVKEARSVTLAINLEQQEK